MTSTTTQGHQSPPGPVAQASECPSTKRWSTACARAALVGLTLLRTDPVDGPQRIFVERFGLVRELRNIDDLESVLIGGAR